eukprot:1429242-Amphidinium_carterae.1
MQFHILKIPLHRPNFQFKGATPSMTTVSAGKSWPTHRLVGKQSPPQSVRAIVAQPDNIDKTQEIRLENNEDKEEKRQM